MIKSILKLESFTIFLTCLYIYSLLGASWLHFVLLWIVPDLSMVGYLKNKRVGAIIYNIVHNYTATLLLVGLGFWLNDHNAFTLGIIFTSHVALDRCLGYGLKYPTSFSDTHLQKI